MIYKGFFLFAFALFVSLPASAQVDQICEESGYIATLEGLRLSAPFIYGRVTILSTGPVAKFPKVIVTYTNRSQSPERATVGKSGNYCFKVKEGNGGLLTVDINGVEVARRNVIDSGPTQKREDFQVEIPGSKTAPAQPAVVSSKFAYPPNEKTAEHYKKAAAFEREKELQAAIGEMKKVVEIDEKDYIAWAFLGNLQFENKQLPDADASYRKSLTLRQDYTPAWVNVGKLRIAQKQPEAAIAIFKHATELDPTDARTFRLLGDTYLQARQGTLGAQALNRAIELDPIGQAECHLQLAHLFQLAGAKHLAAAEYKKYLVKVPNSPEKSKLEKFVRENSQSND